MKKLFFLIFTCILYNNVFSQTELNTLLQTYNTSLGVSNLPPYNLTCGYVCQNIKANLIGEYLNIDYGFTGSGIDDAIEFHFIKINLLKSAIYIAKVDNNYKIFFKSSEGIDVKIIGNQSYNKGVKNRLIDVWGLCCESEVLANKILAQINKIKEELNPPKIAPVTNNANLELQTTKTKPTINQLPFQIFKMAGFKVKCEGKLYVNNTFIQMAKKQGVNNIIGAYVCAVNEKNPNLGVVYNINIYDNIKSYQKLPISSYALFEKNTLEQYAKNLKTAGMTYRYIKFQGVSAIEYTFDQMGLPTKAIMFLKNKKSYLLQVGTRKGLLLKYNLLKSSFVII